MPAPVNHPRPPTVPPFTHFPNGVQTSDVLLDQWPGGPTSLISLLAANFSVATIADLRAFSVINWDTEELILTDNPPVLGMSIPLRVFVAGYYEVGDGGGGSYYWDALSVLIDDGGSVINPTGNAGAGRWLGIFEGNELNVLRWGADPQGLVLSNTAFTNCQAYSLSHGALGASNQFQTVMVPAGEFLLDRWQWNTNCSFVGTEVGETLFVYGGPQQAGSYIVGLRQKTGTIPWAGFYNITFQAWNGKNFGVGALVAQYCILNLGVDLDWGFKIENCAFSYSYGDALKLDGVNHSFTNLFFNRLRFDTIGGHAIVLSGISTNSGHPFVLDEWTYDNGVRTPYSTIVANLGFFVNNQWGTGILRLEDCRSTTTLLSNARVELNSALIPYGGSTSLVYNNDTTGGLQTIELDGIVGTGRVSQTVVFVKDVTGGMSFTSIRSGLSNLAKQFETTTPERDVIIGGGTNYSSASVSRQVGLSLYGHQFEYRNSTPLAVSGGAFLAYRAGDLTCNTTIGAGRATMWQCKFPTTGFAYATSSNITTAAVFVTGNAVVSIPSSAMNLLPIGLRITLKGAGVAGADLPVSVLSTDFAALTVTVDIAPSTDVSPGTIAYTPAQFAPASYQQGVSANNGNASATLTLGIASAPTQIWSSALTADRNATLATSATALGTVAVTWGKFRIVRAATSTGAFNLNVTDGSTIFKALATGQWCEVEWNGTGWALTAFGSL